ncbi:uncharacterized protein EV420DRAFT_1315163 [Desarmillaria tabescens]|uniref:Uncharacterized protein n=1 Tax=Armillaria tabescens TaxID=1929756 RepID=A0AA39JIG3_ARMTA|nr:uncharacterized protein EV420DRAFT_1315163 [Desarmillaria tabescens]KAK0442767.1 hypothetical protein EV420DRAFT_1315163 [Desarmillaria tabescens]
MDASLYTPSKQMRMMTTSLALTSSGSFLVQPTVKITSRHTIDPPILEARGTGALVPNIDEITPRQLKAEIMHLRNDMSLAHQHLIARDGIIESAHATLVVQNIFVEKQSLALNTKENPRPKNSTKVSMEGKGRHLTGSEFMNAVEEAGKAWENQENTRQEKRLWKENAKKQKEELERWWKEFKTQRASESAEREKLCQWLREERVRVKDLPKGPSCVLKADWMKAAIQDLDDKSDDNNDESEEE